MSITQELLDAEEVRYLEFDGLMDRLNREQKERVGYTERWSAKDAYAHLGCWFAEACVSLEQIRMGTYASRKLDIEALNEEFYEIWKDQDLVAVEAEFWSGRTRMLQEWGKLEEPNRLARSWFKESGPKHYDEHLPRLREWVEEVTA